MEFALARHVVSRRCLGHVSPPDAKLGKGCVAATAFLNAGNHLGGEHPFRTATISPEACSTFNETCKFWPSVVATASAQTTIDKVHNGNMTVQSCTSNYHTSRHWTSICVPPPYPHWCFQSRQSVDEQNPAPPIQDPVHPPI